MMLLDRPVEQAFEEVEQEPLSVVHWNPSFKAETGEFVEILQKIDPDILLANEVSLARPRYHPDSLFEAVRDLTDVGSYQAVAETHRLIPRKKGEWQGKEAVVDAIGIFSRFPILRSSETVLSLNTAYDPKHDGQRRVVYLDAEIDTPGAKELLRAGTTHRSIPFPQNRRVIRHETDALNEAISDYDSNFILSGDFNVPPFMYPIRKISPNLTRIDDELATVTVKPESVFGIPFPKVRVDYIFRTADIEVIETYADYLADYAADIGEHPTFDHRILAAEILQTKV